MLCTAVRMCNTTVYGSVANQFVGNPLTHTFTQQMFLCVGRVQLNLICIQSSAEDKLGLFAVSLLSPVQSTGYY